MPEFILFVLLFILGAFAFIWAMADETARYLAFLSVIAAIGCTVISFENTTVKRNVLIKHGMAQYTINSTNGVASFVLIKDGREIKISE